MNNARILSFVGCVGWALYCPPLVWDAFGWRVAEMNRRGPKTSSEVRGGGLARPAALVVVVAAMVAHNLDLSPSTCTADVGPSYLVSAMLNNRWNVFTTAEDRVTWRARDMPEIFVSRLRYSDVPSASTRHLHPADVRRTLLIRQVRGARAARRRFGRRPLDTWRAALVGGAQYGAEGRAVEVFSRARRRGAIRPTF